MIVISVGRWHHPLEFTLCLTDPWTGPKIRLKIGPKIGPKIGQKIGLKIGPKIGFKIRFKTKDYAEYYLVPVVLHLYVFTRRKYFCLMFSLNSIL